MRLWCLLWLAASHPATADLSGGFAPPLFAQVGAGAITGVVRDAAGAAVPGATVNSPPAEFGRFNGGVVNLTTRSGANTLHGTLFEFFRHEAMNARNFFASANPVKPQFRRNQFGGVLGGPIRRERTFFFVDYQLNTPPLGNPHAVLGAPDFCTITTAGDPRVAQLAVKLRF